MQLHIPHFPASRSITYIKICSCARVKNITLYHHLFGISFYFILDYKVGRLRFLSDKMHPSMILSMLSLWVSRTSAMPQGYEFAGGRDIVKGNSKRNHAPVPFNSGSENFDHEHGKYVRQGGNDSPSGGLEYQPTGTGPSPSSPTNKNHKRNDSVHFSMPPELPMHSSTQPSTLATSISSSPQNLKRQESTSTGVPSYWSNHDDKQLHGNNKRLETIPFETPTSLSINPIPIPTSTPKTPEHNQQMSGQNSKRTDPDAVPSDIPLPNTKAKKATIPKSPVTVSLHPRKSKMKGKIFVTPSNTGCSKDGWCTQGQGKTRY